MTAVADRVSAEPAATAPAAALPRWSTGRVLAAASGAAVGAGVLVTSWATRGSRPARITGLPDPGALTVWTLPVVRGLVDLAAMATVGLVALALLLPADGERVGRAGRLLLRRAGQVATGWTVAALLAVPLTVSELTARPLGTVLSGGLVREFAFRTGQTQALLSMAWLAAVVAFCAGATVRRPGAAALGLLAVAASLPPAFTGHAAHGERHSLSVVGLGLHIGSLSLWVGTLVAVVLHARLLGPVLPLAVARYSRLALACFVVVAVSGGVAAWTRLGSVANLWATDYGRVLLVKTGLLVALGAAGWWHRRRTLPRLAAGRRRAFVALAAAEVLVMAATVGVAVGLARTAPPATGHGGATPVAAESVR